MYDSAPTSWTGGLRRSPAQAILPLLTLEDLCELYSPQSSRRSSVNTDMDAHSPTSPVSAGSPTSSEQSLTPNTPIGSCIDLVWTTSKHSLDLSLIPETRISSWNNNKNRRSTLTHSQTLPKDSFAERWSRRRTEIVHRAKIRMSTSEIDPQPSTKKSTHDHIIDQDGDVVMSSPAKSTQEGVGESREDNAHAHKGQSSSIKPNNLHDLDTKLDRVSSTASSPRPASVINSDSTIRSSPAVRHEVLRKEHIPSLESQPLRRSSRSSLRGRSQERTTDRPRYAISGSRSCSRIVKSSSNKPPRIEIQVPDTRRTQLKNAILHLGIPLVPLISVTTGLAHPDFPRSILQYHLLTHDQLDSLARWYHQTFDNTRERYLYPAIIERPWVWQNQNTRSHAERRVSVAGSVADDAETKRLQLSVKRRRFGRFIGLRGCDSPRVPNADSEEDEEQDIDVAEQMEREWEAALRRAEEEERVQEKVWRGRW